MCSAFERRVGIAGQGDGACAAASGFNEGGDGEGGASAGGDAEDYVFFVGLAAGPFLTGGLRVRFAGFRGGGGTVCGAREVGVGAGGCEGGGGLDGVAGG